MFYCLEFQMQGETFRLPQERALWCQLLNCSQAETKLYSNAMYALFFLGDVHRTVSVMLKLGWNLSSLPAWVIWNISPLLLLSLSLRY